MTDDICGEPDGLIAHSLGMERAAPDSNGLGGRIKAARLARGLSMDGLAHLLGMTRQSIAGWEKDKKPVIPDPKLWPEIARILQVRYRWLVEGTGPMEGGEDAEAPRALEIQPLLDSVRAAALAGEYGLAAQGAETLARRCREIEARQQPGTREKPDPTGKRAN